MYQYMHAVDFTCYLLETDILLFVGSLGSQTKESPIINVEFVMFKALYLTPIVSKHKGKK